MKMECRKRSLEKLLSRSFKNNEASIKLHKRLGFKLHLETEDSLVWEMIL
jgi:L-amino acid N-acyltransferase YncA